MNKILLLLVLMFTSVTPAYSAALDWSPAGKSNSYFEQSDTQDQDAPLALADYILAVKQDQALSDLSDQLIENVCKAAFRLAKVMPSKKLANYIISHNGAMILQNSMLKFASKTPLPNERLRTVVSIFTTAGNLWLDATYDTGDPQRMFGKLFFENADLLAAISSGNLIAFAKQAAITSYNLGTLFYEETINVGNEISDYLYRSNSDDWDCNWNRCINISQMEADLALEDARIMVPFLVPCPDRLKQQAIDRLYFVYSSRTSNTFSFKPQRAADLLAQMHAAYDKYKFDDTQDESAWYFPYVHFLHHDGLIDGYPDDTFRPANPVNRAEFIKMVVEAVRRLDGIDAYAGELPSFIDPNQWYSFYMATAYNMKNPNNDNEAVAFWEGTPDLTQGVTRSEAARILLNALKLDPADSSTIYTLTDVTANAHPWVYALIKYNVLGGYPDGSFRPDSVLNRAEAAKMIYMLLLSEGYAPLCGQTAETL